MMKVFNYISESFTELKTNVTWSPWSDVQRYTIIVAIFAVLFSLATWGVDTLFADLLGIFYKWAKA
ncbi:MULTISPECIES: preprotein translocase subunit SecE [Myroides]|uniref:Protein translocase subunit SecE n=1 Tax=Myroides albus TaxID=2562892 RepID=A0A6I3LM63_9FLAO|nr:MULTISPECIES: preprotein translocase subunit SecE [Myroides]MTG97252.1 preprotein translocase subunit SecE [Myroides albus]MVX34271.1 preprotein translocase subunit SecE [Myroides sp. LoEW2-1]UVD81281.1 preprotein translocase subunit SecE [Myroides albus]